MASEKEHRAAIDRTAKRIQQDTQRIGKPITYTQAQDKARTIARRVERKYTK